MDSQTGVAGVICEDICEQICEVQIHSGVYRVAPETKNKCCCPTQTPAKICYKNKKQNKQIFCIETCHQCYNMIIFNVMLSSTIYHYNFEYHIIINDII